MTRRAAKPLLCNSVTSATLGVKVLILAVRLCAGTFKLGDGRKEQWDVCWTLVFSACELLFACVILVDIS